MSTALKKVKRSKEGNELKCTTNKKLEEKTEGRCRICIYIYFIFTRTPYFFGSIKCMSETKDVGFEHLQHGPHISGIFSSRVLV